MFPKTISKDEIIDLPIIKYTGKVEVVNTPESLQVALDILQNESLLGVDTESKPTFRKGEKNNICLIQLAGKDKVFLIRINKTGVPSRLLDLLNDRQIEKVGAGLGDDFLRLKEMGIVVDKSAFIDLGEFLKSYDFEKTGLRNLTAMIMKKRLTKREQTSNWEAVKLSPSQIIYAATDAWICREIYLKLLKNGY